MKDEDHTKRRHDRQTTDHADRLRRVIDHLYPADRHAVREAVEQLEKKSRKFDYAKYHLHRLTRFDMEIDDWKVGDLISEVEDRMDTLYFERRESEKQRENDARKMAGLIDRLSKANQQLGKKVEQFSQLMTLAQRAIDHADRYLDAEEGVEQLDMKRRYETARSKLYALLGQFADEETTTDS